jgi:hypothetical protein
VATVMHIPTEKADAREEQQLLGFQAGRDNMLYQLGPGNTPAQCPYLESVALAVLLTT